MYGEILRVDLNVAALFFRIIMPESLDAELDAIIKTTQANARTSLLPDEITCLINGFLPTHSTALRSKAYIALSAVCQKILQNSLSPSNEKQQTDTATQSLQKTFDIAVISRLSDTSEVEVLAGLSFLTALFEVNWQSASSIFQADGVVESVMDALDIFPTSLQISLAIARLLAQASGHRSCRALISSEQQQWLAVKSRQTNDSALRAAATVTLIKLSRGAGTDVSEVDGRHKQASPTDDEALVNLMRGLIVDDHGLSSLADAIEGLAYMSTDSSVKEILVKDTSFLTRLFSIVPRRKATPSQAPEEAAKSPLYGIAVIIFNICTYRPRLSNEDAQIAKLRHMARTPSTSTSGAPDPESDPLDDDEHVRNRCKKLIECGVLDALTSAVLATDSRTVRLTVGKIFLSLIEDRGNRGKVLQAGGAKALVLIIRGILPATAAGSKSQVPPLDTSEIETIQALAKLAITSSPVQVFGPNEGAFYDAIRPFTLMLTHSSSNLLQRFEALMALTNLSSQSGEMATRIARSEGLLNKVELLMLEEHTMIRRAATELVCNLVGGCEDVFNKYGGEKSTSSKSKVQVLIALCDVDDLPTRLAASGAIATLTSSPDTCASLLELEQERHRVLRIIGQLIDPSIVTMAEDSDESDDEEPQTQTQVDPGLVHRGVVCLRNFFVAVRDPVVRKELAVEANRIGLVGALVGVIKSSENGDSPVLRPTAEAIKWLLESGIEIAV